VLTRALVSVLAAGLAAVLMLAAGPRAALAGGGPGGGNLVGSVTCGQSYSPQCDVTAGSGPSAGTAKAWQPTGDGLAGPGPAGSRPAPARPVRSGTARASGGLPARCPGRGTVSRISRPFIRIREPVGNGDI